MTTKTNEKSKDILEESIIEAKYVRDMAVKQAQNMLEEQLSDKMKKMIEEQKEEASSNKEEDEDLNEEDTDNKEDIISESSSDLNEEDEELDLQLEEDESDKDEKDEEDDEDEDEDLDEDEEIDLSNIIDEEDEDLDEDEEIDLSNIIDEEDEDIDFLDLNSKSDINEEDEDEDEDEEDEDLDEEECASKDKAVSKLKTENKNLKTELEKYKAGLSKINEKLTEYAILNNKLLYANKLFKEYELNQDQKYQIINRLDEGNTKREIKLIYETLQDSFKTSKVKLKENVSFSSDVKDFKRSNKDKIIEEEDASNSKMKSRFKRLAYGK